MTVTPPTISPADEQRLYTIWLRMCLICYDATHPDYPQHGGRGIRICAAWRDDIPAFTTWAPSAGYDSSLWLIRIRLTEDFTPDNCWWVDGRTYRRYIRWSQVYTAFGVTKPFGEWLQDSRCVVSAATLMLRLRQGQPLQTALTTPAARKDRGKIYPYTCRDIPIGAQFSRLTVIGPPDISRYPSGGFRYHYPCQCRCGTTDHRVNAHNLLTGQIVSCGCYFREQQGKPARIHGDAPKNGPMTPLFRQWLRIREICTNPRRKEYLLYGGRGIAVCSAWMEDYSTFRTWAEIHGYQPGMRLTRRDDTDDFTPKNCCWTTATPRSRRTHLVTAFGETKPLADWVRDPRCTVTQAALTRRLQSGMPPEAAITDPAVRDDTPHLVTAFGVTQSVSAWSRDPRCCVPYYCLFSRIRAGWSTEAALITPSGSTRHLLTAFGETKPLATWTHDHRCVVTESILRHRLTRGWTVETALVTPTVRDARHTVPTDGETAAPAGQSR